MGNPINPYAFPGETYEANGHVTYQEGMTMRDWFAGQALAGLCGAFGRVTIKSGETQEQADARWCYARADAMLTERTPR